MSHVRSRLDRYLLPDEPARDMTTPPAREKKPCSWAIQMKVVLATMDA